MNPNVNYEHVFSILILLHWFIFCEVFLGGLLFCCSVWFEFYFGRGGGGIIFFVCLLLESMIIFKTEFVGDH